MRIILSIGIGVIKYQYQANYDLLNRYKKSEWFTERVSQRLNIDKKHIYINRKTTTNTFLKINDDYYRIINSGKKKNIY